MPVINISGVVRDGSGPAVGTEQRISWPRGEPGTVYVTITKADGTAYDPTGMVVALAVRPSRASIGAGDGLPLIARQATIVTVNTVKVAKFALVAADTLQLTEGRSSRFDVWLTDLASQRWRVVPESPWYTEPTVGLATDPVSAP